MFVEVKSSQNGYQKAMTQLFDGKKRLQEAYSAIGLSTKFKYVDVSFTHMLQQICLCLIVIHVQHLQSLENITFLAI